MHIFPQVVHFCFFQSEETTSLLSHIKIKIYYIEKHWIV